jgi:hypothetical protein
LSNEIKSSSVWLDLAKKSLERLDFANAKLIYQNLLHHPGMTMILGQIDPTSNIEYLKGHVYALAGEIDMAQVITLL